MNKLYTRPIEQRKYGPEFVHTVVWDTLGTHKFARKSVRHYYKSARRLMQLSPYQARTYTFGRMLELPVFTIKNGAHQ